MRRGFTLVEILVVVTILSILMGVLVVGLGFARKRAKVRTTKMLLQKIRSALSSYYTDFGAYPPTSLESLGVKVENQVNLGIESLVSCLLTQRKRGPYLRDYKPRELQNYDKDRLPDFNDSANKSGEAFELVDPWGMPYVYLYGGDYEEKQPWVYQGKKKRQVQVRPLLDPKTKNFARLYEYQIWSLGPNGKNDQGKGDDILGW